MSNLKVLRNQIEIPFSSFVFPSGEIGVKIGIKEHFVAYGAKTGMFGPATHQTIVARIQNSADFMELAMLADALRRIDDTPIRLFIPYCPYGRQDRVCVEGESLSLKVFGNLINFLKFSKVITFDPHSSVTESVLDNLQVVTQLDIINKWLDFSNRSLSCQLISADAGANKKVSEIAKYLSRHEFIRADKLRDLSNGNIKETVVYCDDLKKQDVLVCDDLIDGGRTFIELSKVCKAKNCGKFVLFATHGIFSKGILELIENGINEVWTTTSYKNEYICNYPEQFKVLDLEDKFKDLI